MNVAGVLCVRHHVYFAIYTSVIMLSTCRCEFIWIRPGVREHCMRRCERETFCAPPGSEDSLSAVKMMARTGQGQFAPAVNDDGATVINTKAVFSITRRKPTGVCHNIHCT